MLYVKKGSKNKFLTFSSRTTSLLLEYLLEDRNHNQQFYQSNFHYLLSLRTGHWHDG